MVSQLPAAGPAPVAPCAALKRTWQAAGLLGQVPASQPCSAVELRKFPAGLSISTCAARHAVAGGTWTLQHCNSQNRSAPARIVRKLSLACRAFFPHGIPLVMLHGQLFCHGIVLRLPCCDSGRCAVCSAGCRVHQVVCLMEVPSKQQQSRSSRALTAHCIAPALPVRLGISSLWSSDPKCAVGCDLTGRCTCSSVMRWHGLAHICLHVSQFLSCT